MRDIFTVMIENGFSANVAECHKILYIKDIKNIYI